MKSLLVSLADENYIDQAKQLFSSVYFNAGWQGDYMLLAHEIPEEKLKWFLDKGILVKECNPLFEGKLFSGYPNVILDKFYLFTPEFKKWDNVVFLDADIIVRYSINKLAKVKGFYARPDFANDLLENQFNTNKSGLNHNIIQNLISNFRLKNKSFNVGVFAFSTDVILENSFKEIIDLFDKYEKISIYTEQSILNLYFYKKWKKLNFLYNIPMPIMIKRYNLKNENINGIILHFLTHQKPWIINNPFYHEWKLNLEKSESINLKNKTNKNNKIYERLILICFYINFRIIKIFFDFYYSIDKQIGSIGFYLKKHFPSVYFNLQKIIKNKNTK